MKRFPTYQAEEEIRNVQNSVYSCCRLCAKIKNEERKFLCVHKISLEEFTKLLGTRVPAGRALGGWGRQCTGEAKKEG